MRIENKPTRLKYENFIFNLKLFILQVGLLQVWCNEYMKIHYATLKSDAIGSFFITPHLIVKYSITLRKLVG